MNKLKTKHIILIGFLTICFVFNSLTLYFVWGDYGRIQAKRNEAYATNTAKLNAKHIEQWLDEEVMMLNAIAKKLQNYSIQDKDAIQHMLMEYTNVQSGNIGFFLATDQNEMIDGEGWVPSDGYEAAERIWYTESQALKGSRDPYALTKYYDVRHHREVIGISIATNLRDRKCVVTNNIDLERLEKVVQSVEYFDTGVGVILDHESELIHHSHVEDEGMEYVLTQYQQGILEKTIDDQAFTRIGDYVLTSTPIGEYDWNLVVAVSSKEFDAYIDDFEERLRHIFVVILGVCIGLSYIVSRRITAPIEKLLDEVRKLTTGNLKSKIDLKTSYGEIDDLSRQLDRMRINMLSIMDKMELEAELLTSSNNQLEDYLSETKQGATNFMSALSHDIKTPMTLIKGYATGLKSGIIQDKDKEMQYIDNILVRVNQVEQILTNNLNNVYHINKQMVLEPRTLTVRDMVETLSNLGKAYIETTTRNYEESIMLANYDLELQVDILQITRVLDNLLANAVKFSEVGTKVKIRFRQQAETFCIAVADEGCGIPKEEVGKVFEMFYRGSGEKKGYGLGLSVCKAIVEAHGGIMFIHEREQGCEIGFKLPIHT